MLGISLQTLAVTIVQAIVIEKQNLLKQQLFLQGASVTSFWIANYLVDLFTHMIVAISCLIFINIFDIDVPYAWVLLLLFAIADPPFLYFISLFFQKDSSAATATRTVYLIAGAVLPIINLVLMFIEKT